MTEIALILLMFAVGGVVGHAVGLARGDWRGWHRGYEAGWAAYRRQVMGSINRRD